MNLKIDYDAEFWESDIGKQTEIAMKGMRDSFNRKGIGVAPLRLQKLTKLKNETTGEHMWVIEQIMKG